MRDDRSLGGAWAAFQRHGFVAPAPDLAPLISRYWWAHWDLRGQPDYQQLIVPYPSVQLTFGADGIGLVRGVSRGRVQRTLSGVGGAFGVVFRPGIFRRFLNRPVDFLTDRALPAAEIFGADLPLFAPRFVLAEVGADPGLGAVGVDVGALQAFLLERLPPGDPVADEVAGWVEEIAASADLRRVDLVAKRFGVGPRRL